MTHAFHIAASALRASELQAQVSAHNVANVNTPGHRAQRVAQSSQAGGGVTTRIEMSENASTDVVRGFTELFSAAHVYAANGNVARTASAMAGMLVDVAA